MQAALGIGNTAAQHKQLVAEHKILLKSCHDKLGVKEVGKEHILYVVGGDTLAPLKNQYIGFGGALVLAKIDHLHLKTAIRMTTVQMQEYKTTGYNNLWDPTTSITAYFTQLDCFQVSLGNCGISMSKAEKIMAAGAKIWHSKIFMEDQMVAWENKTAVQQTWVELQTYFTEKWLECKQYSVMIIAKQS